MSDRVKSLILVACTAAALPNLSAEATTGKAIIGFPVLGQGSLSTDLYLYACTDASCGQISQLKEYGHITNVPSWPKSNNGPGGASPQTWVFLNLTGSDQYFQFWQQLNGQWQNCILHLTATGANGSDTTCLGIVAVAPPAGVTDNLPYFVTGAAMFPVPATALQGPNPPPDSSNRVPPRALTYRNQSSNYGVCLQTDSSFDHKRCSGAIPLLQGQSYSIPSKTLASGVNSGLGQIAAVKPKKGAPWFETGRSRGANGQVYATNMEYTIWPVTRTYSTGPTTIDISLVNGFNIGARLTVDQDTACYIANSEGGVPYFLLYPAGSTLAQFPNTAASLSQLCPNTMAQKRGCFSPCSYAVLTGGVDSAGAEAACCSSPYNTPETCTYPPTTDYVRNVGANSTRVYTWAFDDYNGTFTCEPYASFTFSVIDAVAGGSGR